MSEQKTDRITLDRETNEHTKRLKKSLNKVKWSHALMQLFWTAGPVTTLGLIGGYYIGYGTMPSIELLLYFVSFTVFSGIIGLIAKVVYDGTRGHLKEQGEHDILNVTNKLGNLILDTRDMIVESFEGDARRREAALQLLRRVDLTPFGVTVAFTDLTGDKEIGSIIGKIYTYRRVGLQSKVRELYSEYRNDINENIKQLEEVSPEAARELKNWFTGNHVGSLKYGVAREPMFLQRIMSAIENNNPYIMTLRDVEEILILAFELISGREIPTLIFSYSGKWKYAKALDELEKKRSNYRVAQAKGGNRIRALSAYLVEMEYATPEELPEGMDIHEQIEQVTIIIDRIAESIRENLHQRDVSSRREAEKTTRVLDTCIELYNMAHRGYKETGKQHTQLTEAYDKWQKVLQESKNKKGMPQLGPGKKDIRILENIISLSEEARLEVCRHLAWYFNKENISNLSDINDSLFTTKRAMGARRIAVEIAVALEPHIRISKPEIQRNINATKAVYLGELSPEMSAQQMAEIGRRMSAEVDNELSTAAEKLAQTLVTQYQVELTDEAKELLNSAYHTDMDLLHTLKERRVDAPFSANQLQKKPPQVPPPKPYWVKTSMAVSKTK